MHSTGTAEQMHMDEAMLLTVKAKSCTDIEGNVFFYTSIQSNLLQIVSVVKH